MQNIATEEAWKELSSEFNWNETMLEKYQDKVDWDEISENRYIRWTIPMMQKFQKKINWNKLSASIDEDILTEGMIEAFKNQWNWHELSGNWGMKLTHEIIEKYADKWDWEQLIDRRNNNVFYGKGGRMLYPLGLPIHRDIHPGAIMPGFHGDLRPFSF